MFRPVFCANILQCVVFKSSSWFLKISYSVLFFMLSKVENPCNCMNLSLALTLKLTAKKQKRCIHLVWDLTQLLCFGVITCFLEDGDIV